MSNIATNQPDLGLVTSRSVFGLNTDEGELQKGFGVNFRASVQKHQQWT